MATFTNLFKGLRAHKPVAEPQRTAPAEDIYRVRPVPNEHIHFYIKPIDNVQVRRAVDKRSQSIGWKSIGGGSMAAILAEMLLVPLSLTIQLGYQLNNLKSERQALMHDKAELILQEESMLSPDRLERLARLQNFIDPEPGKVQYLNPPSDAAFAMKAKRRAENPE